MSKRIPILINFLLVAFFIWLSLTPTPPIRYVITRLDNLFYDLQLQVHVWLHPKVHASTIVIVDIDDASLQALGRWPWPRSVLANMIAKLQKLGAAVIATDMMFSEAEANIVSTVTTTLAQQRLLTPLLTQTLTKILPNFAHDAMFARSLQNSDSIIGMVLLPTDQQEGLLPAPLLALTPGQKKDLGLFQAKGFISNIPILQKAVKATGFLNVWPDVDGTIRRAPIVLAYQDKVYPALALAAVQRYLFINKVSLLTPYYGKTMRLEGVRLGNHVIPTDDKGQVLIPFIGKSYRFPYISALKLLTGKFPAHFLEGKLVFIGTSATGAGDLKATAIDRIFPGVEIQATIANGILTHYFPYKPAWGFGAELLFTLACGIIAACLFPYLGPLMVAILLVTIPLVFTGLLFIEELLWNKTGFIFSILIPMTLLSVLAIFNIVYGYLFEARKRQQLKSIFGQYVPTKHIETMLKAKGNYTLVGEDRDMTVLFADIRNFTQLSEGMTAAELKKMLNAFFTPMTAIIFKHKGTIDKYVGDLIMAFWGAPLADKQHGNHALAAALEMQHEIEKKWPTIAAQHQWPIITMGIGINSGMMSVGDMGSQFRRNYTVLGDEVNIASRVESLTKFYGVNIIATESTQKDHNKYIFRKLDRVRVKGKQSSINIYEVITEQLSEALKQELAQHQQALSFYFDQKFDQAHTLFEQLQQNDPQKKLYAIYLERLNVYKKIPPPQNWDGVFTHMAK